MKWILYLFIISSMEKPNGFFGFSCGKDEGTCRLVDKSKRVLSGWGGGAGYWKYWWLSCGLSVAWVNKCVFKFERWLKDLEQTGHLWGDSSMCRILCTAKVLDWQNPLPHSVHLKGFSLLWMYLKKRYLLSGVFKRIVK